MPHGWKVAASCRGGQKHATHSDIKYIHLLFRPGKPQLGKFPTNFHSVLVFWATFLWRVSYCFFPSSSSLTFLAFLSLPAKIQSSPPVHWASNQVLSSTKMDISTVSPWLFLCFYRFMIKRMLPFWFSFKWKSALSTSKSGFKWMFVIQAWLLQQHKRKMGEKPEIIT